MSDEFLRSPGDAVRGLAIEHQLLPEDYPRGTSLTAVLRHVDLSLLSALDVWPAFEPALTRLAAQEFGHQDAQTVRQWVDLIWVSLTPSTHFTTMSDGDDSELFIPREVHIDDSSSLLVEPMSMLDGYSRQLEESETLSRMDDLRGQRSQMFASVDDLHRSDKKQVLWQWVNDVHISGLQPHQKAILIEEFCARVHSLDPAEVKESGWNLCIGSFEKMACPERFDPVLNDRLLQLVATLPVLTRLRYTNNPHVALAQCREKMREAKYPQVVSALYLADALQLVTSVKRDANDYHLSVDKLCRQIHQGRTQGDEIPTLQMEGILGPVLAKAVFGPAR